MILSLYCWPAAVDFGCWGFYDPVEKNHLAKTGTADLESLLTNTPVVPKQHRGEEILLLLIHALYL